MSNHPAVCAGSHEDDVLHDHMLVVDDFVAADDLHLVFGGVLQLHDVAFRSVEDGFEIVDLVQIADMRIGFLLVCDFAGEIGFAWPMK